MVRNHCKGSSDGVLHQFVKWIFMCHQPNASYLVITPLKPQKHAHYHQTPRKQTGREDASVKITDTWGKIRHEGNTHQALGI